MVSHSSLSTNSLAFIFQVFEFSSQATRGWQRSDGRVRVAFFASMTSWCAWKRILYAGNYKFPQDAYLENHVGSSDTQQILIGSNLLIN